MNHRASIWLSREQYNELCRIESDEFLVGEITMLFDQLDWNADVAPGIRLVAVFGTFDSYVLNGGCFKFFDSWHESRSSDDFLSPILAVPKDIPGCLGLEPILLKGRQLREAIDTSQHESWDHLEEEYFKIRDGLFRAVAVFVRSSPSQFIRGQHGG